MEADDASMQNSISKFLPKNMDNIVIEEDDREEDSISQSLESQSLSAAVRTDYKSKESKRNTTSSDMLFNLGQHLQSKI